MPFTAGTSNAFFSTSDKLSLANHTVYVANYIQIFPIDQAALVFPIDTIFILHNLVIFEQVGIFHK